MDSARRSRPTFNLIGIISEVPIWAFYLVAIVWWVEELELSAYQLIMLGAALELAVLVSEIPTGVIADRFSRAGSVMLSFLLVGGSMLLHAISDAYWVLLLSSAVLGLGWTFRSGADIAWLTDQFSETDDRDEVVGAMIVRRQLLVLLVTAASVPVVVLVGMWSLRGAIVACGVVAIVGGVLVSTRLSDDARAGNPSDPSAPSDAPPATMASIFRGGRKVAGRNPVIRRLLVVVFVVGLGEEVIDRLGYARFLTQGDFGDGSLAFTGALFVVVALTGAGATRLVERKVDGGSGLGVLAAGLIFTTSVGLAMVAILPIAGIAIGLMIADSARETLYPVVFAWANPHTDQESRATVHSFLSLANGIGVVGGSLAAAAIALVGGVTPALWWGAAAFLVGSVLASAADRLDSTFRERR